jgi:nucleoside-diphosphate-sugar epimerase
MKTALVLGAGGFIGSHLVRRLKNEGYWVRGADLKIPDFSDHCADDFFICDLRRESDVRYAINFDGKHFDEIYQLAADMGGAGYIFTGLNDASIMHNSASINLMVLDQIVKHSFGDKPRIFYSSSACMYPEHNQLNPDNPNCEESSAYPAYPDSEYGWEKLFSERMYLAYARNFNLEVRIARFHNIFGPESVYKGGKEKAPAAICRKVIEADNSVDIWGDGLQTRSFLYIDECLEGVRRLMQSDFQGPVNIGSDEMVSIHKLVTMVCNIENKKLKINYISGPTGVRGRNSDNTLIKQKLGWAPSYVLNKGIEKTYMWIKSQMIQIS